MAPNPHTHVISYSDFLAEALVQGTRKKSKEAAGLSIQLVNLARDQKLPWHDHLNGSVQTQGQHSRWSCTCGYALWTRRLKNSTCAKRLLTPFPKRRKGKKTYLKYFFIYDTHLRNLTSINLDLIYQGFRTAIKGFSTSPRELDFRISQKKYGCRFGRFHPFTRFSRAHARNNWCLSQA